MDANSSCGEFQLAIAPELFGEQNSIRIRVIPDGTVKRAEILAEPFFHSLLLPIPRQLAPSESMLPMRMGAVMFGA